MLTAGWVRYSRSAALEKLPVSAMAMNALRLAKSIDWIPFGYPKDKKYEFELFNLTP
ncbi:hypothetical protein EDP1_3996 [Pseudomonas putida S610]|nr:hypothetical protein EDP1_3996 [Pseudomonas putida S610]